MAVSYAVRLASAIVLKNAVNQENNITFLNENK